MLPGFIIEEILKKERLKREWFEQPVLELELPLPPPMKVPTEPEPESERGVVVIEFF